jgi:hypothetical protein
MADRLAITSQGPTLRLVYRMTAEDAAGFEEVRRREAAEKAAAEAEAEEETETEEEAETEDPGA